MKVVFLLLPDVNLLDLSGPAQVLSAAAAAGADYPIVFVAETSSIRSAQGLQFDALAQLGDVHVDEATLVIVPGPDLTVVAANPLGPLVSPAVLEWIRGAYASGASIASVCRGAVVLGDAGLLDGRRCTSHWSVIEAMRMRYPRARVNDDVLFVHDGRVSTSAGIASGIDLGLSFVELHHGPALAAAVARELVVYVRRNGAESPVSPFMAHRDHLNPAVHSAQDALTGDLARAHSLASLARGAHLSTRGLSKAFVAATGLTPAQYQAELRVGLAKTLLRSSDLPIEEIGVACGYRDPRHFRRMFGAHQGVSPSAYRQSAVG